jgi:hypothetical protein
MGVREGDAKREVATNKEAHAGDGELAAHEKDMFCVVEASTVRACGVVRGGGSVTK